MRFRLLALFCACGGLAMAVAVQAASASSVIRRHGARPSRVTRLGPPRTTALPLKGVSAAALRAQIAASATVKSWSSSIRSPLDGHTYKYTMIGKNPLVKQRKPATTITVNVIPVRLQFMDTGTVFDPTRSDRCLPGRRSAKSLFQASPIFHKHPYTVGGHHIGDVQYVDGFQREEFAKYILKRRARNPGYHVNLKLVKHSKVSLSVGTSAGETVGTGCDGAVGLLDVSAWDNYLQNTLLPGLSSSVTPTHLAIFLFYNVVMYSNGNPADCCILGYHSAYGNPAFGGRAQTYSTSDYLSRGLFKGENDIYSVSHEIGEWMDDPYVNNTTPAWGHLGQVSGCQGNLEVGDPLSGTHAIKVKMGNGVTYHGQEMAFRDWFYRTKSVGLNGWFSSRGTFARNAGRPCA